jgi:molybdopterin synthase sulfur carrier subunit
LAEQEPAPQPPSLAGFFFFVAVAAGLATGAANAAAGVAAGAGVAAAGAGASGDATAAGVAGAAGVLAAGSVPEVAAPAAGAEDPAAGDAGVAGAGTADPPQAATPSAVAARPKIRLRRVISISVVLPKTRFFLPFDSRFVAKALVSGAGGASRAPGSSGTTCAGPNWFCSAYRVRIVRRLTITVLYFAAVRELVGQGEVSLILPGGIETLRQLSAHLEKVVPALEGRLGAVRWARNEELVALDATLADGDVIAVIPPVAGG